MTGMARLNHSSQCRLLSPTTGCPMTSLIVPNTRFVAIIVVLGLDLARNAPGLDKGV
jgi:hypothetical protein